MWSRSLSLKFDIVEDIVAQVVPDKADGRRSLLLDVIRANLDGHPDLGKSRDNYWFELLLYVVQMNAFVFGKTVNTTLETHLNEMQKDNFMDVAGLISEQLNVW